MFPIDVSGSIRLRDLANPSNSIKPVADRIVAMLDEAGASEVWLEQNVVRFKRGLFGGGVWSTGWNILAPFDSGTIRLDTEDTSLRVRYRWSTIRMMLIVTGLMAVVLVPSVQHNVKHPVDWQLAIKFAGLGWLWLFGMNYLIGMIRVPLWIKRELKEVTK